MNRLYPATVSLSDVIDEAGDRGSVTQDMLIKELTADARLAYEKREQELGEDTLRELERRVVLSVLDRKWREHLYEMDYLQEGIHLRAMAQRDPLVEYQREGYQLFQAMTEAIKEESIAYLFHVEVEVQQPEDNGLAADAPVLVAKGLVAGQQRPAQLQYSAPSEDVGGGVEVHQENPNGTVTPTDEDGTPVNRASRRAARKKGRR